MARFDEGPPAGMPQLSLPRPTKVVKRLLIAYAAVFLVCFLAFLGSEGGAAWGVLVRWLGLDASWWISAFPFVPVWQLGTYGFLHDATDPWHLAGNALVLYFFGTLLEDQLGSRRFLLTYLGAQLAGAALYLAVCALGLRTAPVVGASGAVYGVMVAAAVLRPRQVVYFLFIPVLLKWLALVIVGVTVIYALLQLKGGGGGVAHIVHLGGIAYGFLAIRTGLARFDPIEALARRRSLAHADRAREDEQRMDALLERIHRQGMGSLTRSERAFLKRVSSRR